MHFEDRVGRNLAIEAQAGHEWGYYPRMTADEALLFFAFDSSAADGDVGVVHTAFDDPAIDGAGVPRRSVELRTVALWDKPVCGGRHTEDESCLRFSVLSALALRD